MATTLTTNLKLRVADNLTADAKFNLNRIDTLGGLFQTDNTGQGALRALGNITVEPNSSDLGGSGAGGTISFGNSTATYDFNGGAAQELAFDCDLNTVTNIRNSNVAADAAIQGSKILAEFGSQTLKTDANLEFTLGSYTTTIRPSQSGQAANLVFTLPSTDGSSGQVLTTDGSGGMSWATVSGSGSSGFTDTWIPDDGLLKIVTHNLGTRNLIVQVIDNNNNYRTIDLEVDRPTDNTIELEANELPSGTWTVLILAV